MYGITHFREIHYKQTALLNIYKIFTSTCGDLQVIYLTLSSLYTVSRFPFDEFYDYLPLNLNSSAFSNLSFN
jgi:hypothetical protein